MGNILLIPHGTANPETADIYLGAKFGLKEISTNFDIKTQPIAYGEKEEIVSDRKRKGTKIKINGVIDDTAFWTNRNDYIRKFSQGEYYLVSAKENKDVNGAVEDMQLISHFTAADSRAYQDVDTDNVYLYSTYQIGTTGYLEKTRISDGVVVLTKSLATTTVRGCAYRNSNFCVLLESANSILRKYFVNNAFGTNKDLTLTGITIVRYCDMDDDYLFLTCADATNNYVKKIRLSDMTVANTKTYTAVLRGICIINKDFIAVGKDNGNILTLRYSNLSEFSETSGLPLSTTRGMRSNGQYIWVTNGTTKVMRITRDMASNIVITPVTPNDFSAAQGIAVGFEEIYIADNNTTKQRIQRRYNRPYQADNKSYLYLDAQGAIKEEFFAANLFNYAKFSAEFAVKKNYWQAFVDSHYDDSFSNSGSTKFSFTIATTLAYPKLILEVGVVPVNQSGTALAGGTATITLSSGASTVDDFYNGMQVEITSGTGSGQKRLIADYVGATTKIATVDSNWTTLPDGTSVYRVRSGQFKITHLNSNLSMTYDDLNSATPLDTGDILVIDCLLGKVTKNFTDDIAHFSGNFFEFGAGMQYFTFTSNCTTYTFNLHLIYTPLI